MKRRAHLLAHVVFVVPALACSDDPDPEPGPGTGNASPAFVVSSQVFEPDGPSTFVGVVGSIAEGELDITGAIEVPGRALAVGPEGQGYVFVTSGESPEITRFEVRADGSLEAGQRLSFAGRGINTLPLFPGNYHFVSDTKAYLFDGPTAQLVIWNPTDMVIIADVDLFDALGVEGGTLNFSFAALARDDEVVVSTGNQLDNNTRIGDETRVLFVDTNTDAFEVASFQGCGGMLNAIKRDNGDIYLSAEGVTAALHRVAGAAAAPEPCLLRIPANARTIENTVPGGSLSALMGTVACSLVRGAADSTFLLTLDESLAQPEQLSDFGALRGGPFWRLQQIDVSGPTAGAVVDGLDPGPNSSASVTVGGETYTLVVAPDFSSTRLVQLGGDELRFGLTAPGLPLGIVQAR